MSAHTADTSVVVAGLAAWHDDHEAASAALAGVDAIPSHALLEAYAVLTRLPGGLAVAPSDAARVLAERFPAPALELDPGARSALPARLAGSGVHGGASYDALVALEAAAHEKRLLTLDARAIRTYDRLGVPARGLAT